MCDAQAVLRALNMCEQLDDSAARMAALLRGLTEADGFNQLWCVRACVVPSTLDVRHAHNYRLHRSNGFASH